jgi:hypothetical protein
VNDLGTGLGPQAAAQGGGLSTKLHFGNDAISRSFPLQPLRLLLKPLLLLFTPRFEFLTMLPFEFVKSALTRRSTQVRARWFGLLLGHFTLLSGTVWDKMASCLTLRGTR